MLISWNKSKIAWTCAAGIAAMAWMLPNLKAQFGGGGLGTAQGVAQAGGQAQEGGGMEGQEDPPRIYYRASLSAEATATSLKLGRKVPMRFPNETPLEDFIRKVKELTVDKDEPEGVMIYVDPIGLQEAEKTLASTITLDLTNIKLETALKLALNQLDLCYYVTEEGLVMITSKDSKNGGVDANALILDRLDALRAEVRQLRMIVGNKK
jgi:hypothetical protein